ncbi:MAG: ankyrin repeat domain-containing protein [Pseudomonadota bacterium]
MKATFSTMALALGCVYLCIGCATTIHEAAMKGKIDSVKEHLAAGEEVDARDQYGKTPLILASSWGHLDIMELLIEKGANVNVERQGWTPLISAAASGHVKGVKLLLSKGADINALEGRALSLATMGQNADMVKTLIKAKIKVDGVNENGVTPLWQTAFYDMVEMAKLLIDAGADVNYRTPEGVSVLAVTRTRGSKRVEALLMAANAKL